MASEGHDHAGTVNAGQQDYMMVQVDGNRAMMDIAEVAVEVETKGVDRSDEPVLSCQYCPDDPVLSGGIPK